MKSAFLCACRGKRKEEEKNFSRKRGGETNRRDPTWIAVPSFPRSGARIRLKCFVQWNKREETGGGNSCKEKGVNCTADCWWDEKGVTFWWGKRQLKGWVWPRCASARRWAEREKNNVERGGETPGRIFYCGEVWRGGKGMREVGLYSFAFVGGGGGKG